MRHLVKYYRFIDIAAVVMCLLTTLLSRYWYICLIAYFVLRVAFLAFYWPHIWCRCVCSSGSLIILCSTVVILIFSCYLGLPYLTALPHIIATEEVNPFVLFLPLLLCIFVFSVMCCRIGQIQWYKGKLPPFKRHPRADSMSFRWGNRGAYFYS